MMPGDSFPNMWIRSKAAIFKEDPFQTLDTEGVGMLIKWAIEKGRKTRPKLEDRHLRRARRRCREREVLPSGRDELCQRFAVSRADRPAGGGSSGDRRRARQRVKAGNSHARAWLELYSRRTSLEDCVPPRQTKIGPLGLEGLILLQSPAGKNTRKKFLMVLGAAIAVLAALSALHAQGLSVVPPFSADRFMAHIRTLSSDEFQGRGPGTKGEELPSRICKSNFATWGSDPGNPDGTYLQTCRL